MRSWAAVASSTQPKAIKTATESITTPSPAPAPSGNSQLLQEASKSRADVKGVRRCLACGRAFDDIQRFAQHLKDAHGGINTAQRSTHARHQPATTRTAGRPAPTLQAAVQLGDLLLRARPADSRLSKGKNTGRAPAAAGADGNTRLYPPATKEPKPLLWRQQQELPKQDAQLSNARPPQPALAIQAQPASKADGKPAPPPGTRGTRGKRESRLKRAFRRSSAIRACSRWSGVLAEVEAALQALGEAQGALANRLDAVHQRLNHPRQQPPQAVAAQQSCQQLSVTNPGQAAVQAVASGEAADGQAAEVLLLASLKVEEQLLAQQAQHAAECWDQLRRAHDQARRQLAAAQEELQKLEGVPPPPADSDPGVARMTETPVAAAEDSIGKLIAAPQQAVEGSQLVSTMASTADQPAAGLLGRWAPADQPGGGTTGSSGETTSSGDGIQRARQATVDDQPTFDDGQTEAGAPSVATSTSLGSFAFQDVLSGWAAAGGRWQAAGAAATAAATQASSQCATRVRQAGRAPVVQAAPQHTDRQGAGRQSSKPPPQADVCPAGLTAGGRDVACTSAALAVPAVAAAAPPAGSSSAEPFAGAATDKADARDSRSGTGDGDGGSSSGTSSGGSFAAQWGDQLLGWASQVRSKAAALARQTTPAAPTPAAMPPAQQQAAAWPLLARGSQLSPHRQQTEREIVRGGLQQSAADSAAVQSKAAVVASTVQGCGSAGGHASAGVPAQSAQAQRATTAEGQSGSSSPGIAAGSQPGGTAGGTAAALAAPSSPAQHGHGGQRQQPPAHLDVGAWLISAQAAGGRAEAPDSPQAPQSPAESPQEQPPSEQPPPSAGHMPQAEVVGAPAPALPTHVQAAEGARPGTFCCLLCQVTVSGQRNLSEHLGSRRHSQRVAAAAAAADVTAGGRPFAAPARHCAVAARHESKAGALLHAADPALTSAKAVAIAMGAHGTASKTYMGPHADVEPYVCQVITPELNSLADGLLRQLLEWQERSRRLNPANFKRRRRLVSGLREVEKAVRLRKAKLVLLAPNIASLATEAEGEVECGAAAASGTGQQGAGAAGAAGPTAVGHPAEQLVEAATAAGVQLVFCLSRQRMGKLLGHRQKKASAFAVLDANGVFDEVKQLVLMADEGRRQWRSLQLQAGAMPLH